MTTPDPDPAPDDELDRLFAALAGWLAAGHHAAIATVIATWGSAPRRPGAHLAIRDDGLFEGSVSGGCVEGDVIMRALDLIARPGFARLDYGVTDATAWEVGLACGGTISVLVQSIDPAFFDPALVAAIPAARRSGRLLAVTTDLATGASRAGDSPGAGRFVNAYAPPLRLAIIGAVHVAQALAPMARMAGYAVSLVDPRASFAAAARLPGFAVDERWPDEFLGQWRPDLRSAIVTLSHDPKIDDPALAAALGSDAFYIAALGSRRTHAARLGRLAALGFGEAALERINGPAGLAIGAIGPAEIAVSILAQMTATLRAAG